MVFQIYFYFNQNLEISRTHSNPSPSTTPPPIFLLLRLRLCNLDDIPGATALTMKMKNDSGSEKSVDANFILLHHSALKMENNSAGINI